MSSKRINTVFFHITPKTQRKQLMYKTDTNKTTNIHSFTFAAKKSHQRIAFIKKSL